MRPFDRQENIGSSTIASIPAAQERIRSRCFHPSGDFLPFESNDVSLSIAERFEKQAQAYPERLAVVTDGDPLTYDALNQRANRLALSIRAATRPGSNIGLLLEKSTSSVVAMIAAAKAGVAFVAVDPSFPRDRLAYMLDDAQVQAVICSDQTMQLARDLAPKTSTIIDAEHAGTDSKTELGARTVGPESIAYIVYTSGSTGQPKGIVHTNRNVLHNISNYTNALHVCRHDRWAMLHSGSFSSGLNDVLIPLLNGASLHIWNFGKSGFVMLDEWINRERITILNWGPTPLRHFAATLAPDSRLSDVRVLMLGNEAVTSREVKIFNQHCRADSLMVSRLGATETNNFCLYFLDQQTTISGASVPAGFPVSDKQVILYDEQGDVIREYGKTGEIGVRSEYLAIGYWNRPDRTAKVFLDDPDGGKKRIYMTGDLGRLQPDGCLEFVGRRDDQIQIRGYRIEVTEIEHRLLEDLTLEDAAVIAYRDAHGDNRLVAYVVSRSSSPIEPESLREQLAKSLPSYMVPSEFIALDVLPRSATGKLARGELAARLETKNECAACDRPAPSLDSCSALEKQLAIAWRQLLRVNVGIHDNFFDLGGNSLLAARLFSGIEKTYGVQLPLSILFQAPTVAQLAELLEGNVDFERPSSLVSIQPNGSRPPLFFVHAHGGNVIGYYDLSSHLGDDQPFYGLQARGLDDPTEGLSRIETMASCYIRELQSVQPSGPYYLGGWCFGGKVALEMARQLRERGEEVGLLVLVESTTRNYPQWKPGLSRLQRLGYCISRRIDFEFSWLQEIEGQRRIHHVFDRLNRVRELIQVRLESAVDKLLVRIGKKRSPSSVYRNAQLQEIHRRAFRSYVYRPYGGNVLMLRAEKQRLGIQLDPTLGWGDLIDGDLEIVEIPGYGIGMLSEPRVKIAAQRIREGLSAAQLRTRPSETSGPSISDVAEIPTGVSVPRR